jgi:hypothetical protein
MFNRVPRNEKWETIQLREAIQDAVFVVLAAPVAYVLIVMAMCL